MTNILFYTGVYFFVAAIFSGILGGTETFNLFTGLGVLFLLAGAFVGVV